MNDDDTSCIAHLIPFSLATLTKIGGGRNSRVFKATAHTGQAYLIKQYFQCADDTRERLNTEWTAFTFLHAHGITCVPRPILRRQREHVAVYEYIEGQKPEFEAHDVKALLQIGDFWEALYSLRREGALAQLPPASDACFCLKAIAEQLHTRFNALLRTPHTTTVHNDMHAFVRQKLLPLAHTCIKKAEDKLHIAGEPSAALLPESWRMPSPSDFGFHNALQNTDGKLIFVDFEYFGMDDPVKLLADTCLHPAMMLTCEQKKGLARRMQNIAASGGDEDFGTRFAYFFPLWRCKWCCIVLNAFVPHYDARRAFAQGVKADTELLQRQLAKAQHLAEEEHYEHERIFFSHA